MTSRGFLTAALIAAFAMGASAAEPQTELTTPALQKAVEDYKASPKGATAYATWGEFVTGSGESFVPVMLYIPKSSNLTVSGPATFFGVVQDGSGKNVQAFEVPASVTATESDFYVDRSLTGLPAGQYRGIFGLAQNGTVLTLASADMT